MENKQVTIIFVTETKAGFESDDFYLKRFVNYACKGLLMNHELTIQYLHMDGIGNYNKTKVLSDIRYYQRCSPFGPVYVIYVVDRDRLKDGNRLNDIESFAKSNNYNLVVNCRTIEDVFMQKIQGTKRLTAMQYKQQPDEVYRQRRFYTDLQTIKKAKQGCSNLGLILDAIISNAQKGE